MPSVLLKHPLGRKWALWFFDRSISKKYEDCFKKIGTFDTIEDFWSFYHYLKPASTMRYGCDLCLFLDGIIPAWEDISNKPGGRWDITVAPPLRHLLDSYWMEIQMALIGENLGSAAGVDLIDLVNGAIVSRRDKVDRISVWTNISSNRYEKLTLLGRKLKNVAGLPKDQKIIFRVHDDCASSINSNYRHTSIEV